MKIHEKEPKLLVPSTSTSSSMTGVWLSKNPMYFVQEQSYERLYLAESFIGFFLTCVGVVVLHQRTLILLLVL